MTQRPRPRPGLYDDPYWEHIARGELRLQRCHSCREFRYPPGPVCPGCLHDEDEWVALSGRGRLLSWTVFHRQYFPGMSTPYVVAAVRTDEGPIVIGNAVSVDRADLRLDMLMTAVIEDVVDPDGSWRICQWQPQVTPQ